MPHIAAAEAWLSAPSEDGGHPAPVAGEDAAADGVHAAVYAVYAVQAAAGDAPGDRPECAQLAGGDHAVLTRREHRDLAIQPGWDQFQTTVVSF